MSHWEYLTIEITFEKHDYVVTFTSGRKLYGMKAILEEYDAHGWEYINMVPSLHRLRAYRAVPRAYIAFFRRPRAANSSASVEHQE